MKKSSVFLFLLLLCLLLLTACGGAPEGPPEEAPVPDAPAEPAIQQDAVDPATAADPVYDGYPDMTDLVNLDNEERLYECNIPEDVLASLSTEDLVDTILLHPMLPLYCDINSMPVDTEYGRRTSVHVEYMEQTFNAVPELFRREDALEVLRARCLAQKDEENLFPNAVLVGLCLALEERDE